MKTLDEVIETAPYIGTEWTNDALHYLREYRKQMTDPDGDHQQLEKVRKLLQDFYRNGRGEDDNLERH